MSSAHTHPFYLHRGTVLLAKTCPKCGDLLDAECFRRYAGHWMTNCKVCDDQRHRKRVDHHRSEFNARCQAATLPAPNHRAPWSYDDHQVLANPHLTVLEKAVQLGRTFYGTNLACSRWKYPSRVEAKADNEGGRWMIKPATTI